MHRRPRRLVRAVAAALAAAASLALVTASARAAETNYVALGDSYSAGLGAGSYVAASGACKRSTKAYSALWAAEHSPASYVSVACSGATTSDVADSQVSALSEATTLVSVTIGGNDVGFSSVMTNCVLWSTRTCVNHVDAAENEARTVLPGRLDAAYDAIRAHAPDARVVVIDYPRLYHVGVWYCLGISDTARAKLNEGADLLDAVIKDAAARHGFAFADVASAFGAGHEICDGSAWLHSVDWSDLDESYHPTANGQARGYLPALSSAVS